MSKRDIAHYIIIYKHQVKSSIKYVIHSNKKYYFCNKLRIGIYGLHKDRLAAV